MVRLLVVLTAWLAVIALLAAVGPTLIALLHAAVPLVIAVGVVVAVLRLVWHFTSLYR